MHGVGARRRFRDSISTSADKTRMLGVVMVIWDADCAVVSAIVSGVVTSVVVVSVALMSLAPGPMTLGAGLSGSSY